jgi:hypothetical protein
MCVCVSGAFWIVVYEAYCDTWQQQPKLRHASEEGGGIGM